MSYIIEIEQTNQDIDVVVSESTNDVDVSISASTISYNVEVDSNAGISLGKDGDSAYDVAVTNGFVGTEQEWLDSLVGPALKGDTGDTGADGADGADGDSAYDVWIAEGNVGNTSDFINAITGENGKDGLSAYEVWSQSNAGSESDYLNSLIGADGQQGPQGIQGVEGQEGASAYQVALMSGFSGTQQEWLDSLVGADGVDATPYDDTAIQAEVDANTAKVSNVDHPLVETAVPIGAVFTDTIYDDSDVLKDSDTVSSVTAGNKIITEIDVAALGGGDMLASTYDPIINANTAKVSNVDHPLVETAVPIGAVFTDTDTVYDDTAIQAEVALNTAKVSFPEAPVDGQEYVRKDAAWLPTSGATKTTIAFNGAFYNNTVGADYYFPNTTENTYTTVQRFNQFTAPFDLVVKSIVVHIQGSVPTSGSLTLEIHDYTASILESVSVTAGNLVILPGGRFFAEFVFTASSAVSMGHGFWVYGNNSTNQGFNNTTYTIVVEEQ